MMLSEPLAGSPGLRLMLDTADRAAWAKWLPVGCFYGVTMNPLLLEAAGAPCALPALAELIGDALKLGAREVHAQTWGRTRALYYDRGSELAAIDPRVVVKVPTTIEGAAAAAMLGQKGVRVTMTAVYSAAQALAADALGADYAAPYLGRMNDLGRDGFGEIVGMARAVRAYGGAMRILVASLREPSDIVRLAGEGVDAFTFNPKVAAGFFADDAAAQAVEAFEAAAEASTKV